MDVMTKAEVDKVERIALDAKPIRPRDAATLILLDRKGDEFLVLMGRRHARHAFMPGKFVFPGGRTDPADSRIPVATALQPEEQARLTAGVGRTSPARARAIALSAIRETYEEAGLLIGQKGAFATTRRDWQGFAEHGVRPSLEALRFVARAITPPNRVRRFDTRFFSAWREDVAVELPDGGPTNELEELVWLQLAKAREADIP
ncbi:MAG: NUDIX hydrolase, partial [Mesorhizobium sp.]